MEGKYEFNVKWLGKNTDFSILRIRPKILNRRIYHYPANFSELNVPLTIKPSKDEYFLDFDNSFNENKQACGEICDIRLKRKNLLNSLVVKLDSFIIGAMNNDDNSLERGISINIGSNEEIVCRNIRRNGKPKTAKGYRGPRLEKSLSVFE